MKDYSNIVGKLERLLQYCENYMNEKRINMDNFLPFMYDTIISASKNGCFEGIENFEVISNEIYNEYCQGGELKFKGWNSRLDELVEELCGFLAEKLA